MHANLLPTAARKDSTDVSTSYVLPVDIATTSELVKYVGLLPGMVTVSFDGVTANRKSKVR